MANVLVIGLGYLGSCLIHHLRATGHTVSMASRNGANGCLDADLGCRESIEQLATQLGRPPDWIIHCASSSRGGPDAYHQVFENGIEHLTSSFAQSTIILTSSTSVYPQTDGVVVTEESPANPDRETGKALRRAEDQLLESGGIVLRLAGIYGPNRSVHIKRMLSGTATIESGSVSRYLNQIHRDDASQAIAHLIGQNRAECRGQIYNVTDDQPISQRECYERLAAILDRPTPQEAPQELDRKRAWTHKQVANQKLKTTGWQPQFPTFIEAVHKTDPRLVASIVQDFK